MKEEIQVNRGRGGTASMACHLKLWLTQGEANHEIGDITFQTWLPMVCLGLWK